MSPAISRLSTRKHWLPGVWPGVWMSSMEISPTCNGIARAVRHELTFADVGDLVHPLGLVGLDVDGYRRHVEELADAGDPHAHHVPADVVGVVVGGERAGEGHVVFGEDLDDADRVVGGIDGDCLAGHTVTDQVYEVDHLAARSGPAARSHARPAAAGSRGGPNRSTSYEVYGLGKTDDTGSSSVHSRVSRPAPSDRYHCCHVAL